MRRSAQFAMLMGILLVGAMVGAYADTGRPADPAEWAPADALLYVGVTDVDRVWEDFKRTGGYALMSAAPKEESPTDFDYFGLAVTKIRERAAAALDVPAAQLKSPFRGPLAFYVAAPSLDPNAVTPGLVAGVGDAELMHKYYDTAVAKLKNVAQYERRTADGVNIDVFTHKEGADEKKDASAANKGDEDLNEFDADESSAPEQFIKDRLDELFSAESLPPTLALCLTEDRLIITGSVEQTQALARGTSTKSLAATDDGKSFGRYFKELGPVRVLVNIPRIMEMARANIEQDEKEDFEKTCRIVGTESLGCLLGHFQLGLPDRDSQMEFLLRTSNDPKGVVKLLRAENTPLTPAASVPGSAWLHVRVNANIANLVEEVERLIRQADPEAADEFAKSIESVDLPTGEKVSPRNDLLRNLVGPLTLTMDFAKPLGPTSLRMLVSIGQRDAAAIARFFSAMGPQLVARDLRGTQVFDTVFPPGLSVAAAPDRLLFGNTPAVEAGLQASTSDALGESAAWKKLARYVPEKAWLVAYVDQRQLMSAALDLAKQGTAGDAEALNVSSMALAGIVESLASSLPKDDPAKARELIKHTGQTMFTVSSDPDGLRLMQVVLKPAD